MKHPDYNDMRQRAILASIDTDMRPMATQANAVLAKMPAKNIDQVEKNTDARPASSYELQRRAILGNDASSDKQAMKVLATLPNRGEALDVTQRALNFRQRPVSAADVAFDAAMAKLNAAIDQTSAQIAAMAPDSTKRTANVKTGMRMVQRRN